MMTNGLAAKGELFVLVGGFKDRPPAMQRLWSPVTITQLTIDQHTTNTGGGMFAKLDGFKTSTEGKVLPSVEGVCLGLLGFEEVFSSPLGGEGVFKTQNGDTKRIVIVGHHHTNPLHPQNPNPWNNPTSQQDSYQSWLPLFWLLFLL